MMPAMDPPLPGTMSVVLAPEMRPLVDGYKAVKTSDDEISPWSHAGAILLGTTRPDRQEGRAFFVSALYYFFLFHRRHSTVSERFLTA